MTTLRLYSTTLRIEYWGSLLLPLASHRAPPELLRLSRQFALINSRRHTTNGGGLSHRTPTLLEEGGRFLERSLRRQSCGDAGEGGGASRRPPLAADCQRR